MEWQEEAIEALGLKKDSKQEEDKPLEKKPLEEVQEEEEVFEGVEDVKDIPKGEESKYGI